LFHNPQIIEYEDGTPASRSQLAKDVTSFLAWSASPENDKRKLLAIKVSIVNFHFVIKR